MSATPRGSARRRPEVAAGFLEYRRRVLPFLDLQEDLLLRLLRRNGHELERVLDLGSGAGALSALILSEWPRAQAVLVDASAPMLERVPSRLAGFEGRWLAVQADLSGDWTPALPAPARFDAAVSALAIHHLDSDGKRRLFASVLDLLEPGALFLNMDYVSVTGPLQGVFEEQMAINLVHALRERGSTRPEQELTGALSVSLDADDEDLPDTAEDQVAWLTEAGFLDAQIHFKWGEVALYGGAAPAD